MPDYVVFDPTSGRSIKFSGAQPPDAEAIKQALSMLPKGPEQLSNPQPRPPLEALQKPIEAAADFVRGATVGTDWSRPAVDESLPARAGEFLAAALPLSGAFKLTKAAQSAAVPGARLGTLARTLRAGEEGYELRQPTVDRLRYFYERGNSLPSTSNWEGAQADELLQAFGGDADQALRWARLWGATSPKTSVPVNTREAVSAFAHYLENPNNLLELGTAQNLPGAKITMAPNKIGNINRAFRGEPLSGDKVEAMAGFMSGQSRIPIDVHTLYALGSRADNVSDEYSALRGLMTKAEGLPARGGLTNTDIYHRYEEAVSQAIQAFAPDRYQNQIFAELWEGARSHKGLKPQGGPIDILRKKGLLEAGAMLEPDRLRAALAQKGWTAPAIAGLFSAIAGGSPDEGGEGSR